MLEHFTVTSSLTQPSVLKGFTMCFWIVFLDLFMLMTLMAPISTALDEAIVKDSPVQNVESCEWQSFNVTCPTGSVIMIGKARYGRRRLSECITQNYGHIGCGTDVTTVIAQKCSGQMSCMVSVISLHDKRSCPKDFKSSLEVSYYCLKVASDTSMPSCLTGGNSGVNLTSGHGFISSSLAMDRGVGNSRCPWTIRVHPHQRLNISLLEFSPGAITARANGYVGRRGGSSMGGCRMQQYAVIWDRQAHRNVTFCATQDTEPNRYESAGSQLDIFLTLPNNPEKLPGHFLLRYEVVGCPPLDAPYNGWLEGTQEHAIVRCNTTDEMWFLTCKGTQWIGELGNCSEMAGMNEAEWRITNSYRSHTSFPFGLLIVVALGVAIGVAVGLVMLVSVLAYMKRRRRRRVRSRSNYLLKNVTNDPHMEVSKLQNGGSNPGGGGGDRSPMLKRAASLGNTNNTQRNFDYLNSTNNGTTTWHIKRTIMDGSLGMNTSGPECCPVHRSADDLDVSPYVRTALASNCTATNVGGATMRALQTFKPRSALRDLFNPGGSSNSGATHSPKHDNAPSTISVTRYSCPGALVDEASPYYFKLDPVSTSVAGQRIVAENALNVMAETDNPELKPDVLPGCAECQEQNRVPNTIV